MTRGAWGAWGDTYLAYSGGNQTLSGYAFTLPEWEPWWPYYIQWCQPGELMLQCEVWEYVQVEVDVRLDSPYGTYFWESAAGFYEAPFMFPAVSSPAPGLWIAWSDHHVRWNRYLLPCVVAIPGYCYFEGAEYLGQLREYVNTTVASESVPASPPCNPGEAYSDTLSDFFARAQYIRTRHEFDVTGSTFSFSVMPWADPEVLPTIQNNIVTSLSMWDVTKFNACGTFSVQPNLQGWGNDETRNVVYSVVSGLMVNGEEACASHVTDFPQGGTYLAHIRVQPGDPMPGSCGPQAEALAHELGHFLGFGHALNQYTSDIMKSPREGVPRSVEAHHAMILVNSYD